MSLIATLKQLKILAEYAQEDRKLEDLNDEEVDTLKNAVIYLEELVLIKSKIS